MGIYRRKETGIFYLKKMINGELLRVSLGTKDRYQAMSVFRLWEEKFIFAKITGTENLPLPINFKSKQASKTVDPARPSLSYVFGEHFKVTQNKHISEEHLKSKEIIGRLIRNRNIQWGDINQQYILNLQADIQKDFSPHTAYKIIAHLKTFLNYCVKQNYFNYHDYKRIDFMKRPPRTSCRTKISDEDMNKIREYLVQKADFDFLYVILTQLCTVSRPNEIRKLKVSDIDYNNRIINIFQYKTPNSGGKPMPLNKGFLDTLIQLAKINDTPEGYIFHGALRNKEFYGKKFKILKDKLGLNPRYTLYSLRNTSISFIAKHHGLATAQQMAGHTSPKMILDHYYTSDPKDIEKAGRHLAKMGLGRL